jgi:hypothetical protein
MKTYGGVETSLHVFLISALHEWQQSVSYACGFDFRETIFGTHFTNSWVDPSVGLDTVGNRKPSVPTWYRTLIPRSSIHADQANFKQMLDSGVLGFGALPAASYPEIHKRIQRFGNWVCFQAQLKANTYSVGSLRKSKPKSLDNLLLYDCRQLYKHLRSGFVNGRQHENAPTSCSSA